jgi:hypothetical protein
MIERLPEKRGRFFCVAILSAQYLGVDTETYHPATGLFQVFTSKDCIQAFLI